MHAARRTLRVGWMAALAGVGVLGAQAQTLDQAEARTQRNIEEYRRHRQTYERLERQAESKRFEVESDGAFNDVTYSVSLTGPPSSLSDVTPEKMVHYLPAALVEDINRRIAREYFRGHYEWKEGLPVPWSYANFDSNTRIWYQRTFVNWNREYLGEAPSVFGLIQDPIDQERIEVWGSRGGDPDISREVEAVQRAARVAEQTVQDLLAFQPDIQEQREERGRFSVSRLWGNTERVTRSLANEGDWNLKKGAVESAFRAYHTALENLRNKVINGTRAMVEQAVDYRAGDVPTLILGGRVYDGGLRLPGRGTGTGTGNGFGTGTGNGYDYDRLFDPFRMQGRRYIRIGDTIFDADDSGGVWTYLFDQRVMQGIPEQYQREVRRRIVYAYFRGGLHAKYDAGFSQTGWYGDGWGRGYDPGYTWRRGTGTGTGTGSGFGTGTGSGTGDGYSGYGGSRREGDYYRGGRTPRAWTNTGTGGQGTGTGTGSGTGTGGSGIDDPWGDLGGSGTGTGTGSGTGTGTGGTRPDPWGSSSGTGTGSGSGTGTGTGSGGSRRGTGTGTGSGSGSGTGTGTGTGG